MYVWRPPEEHKISVNSTSLYEYRIVRKRDGRLSMLVSFAFSFVFGVISSTLDKSMNAFNYDLDPPLFGSSRRTGVDQTQAMTTVMFDIVLRTSIIHTSFNNAGT